MTSLRRQKKLLLYALLGGLIVVASSLLSAWMLTWFYPVELTTAFLGAAPGGIAEMGLTAALIHADVSIVSAYQIFSAVVYFIDSFPICLSGGWDGQARCREYEESR